MSISFFSGLKSTPEQLQLNFSNMNAVDYLQAIGSTVNIEEGYGSIPFTMTAVKPPNSYAKRGCVL